MEPTANRPAPGWYDLAAFATARGFDLGPVEAARRARSGARHPGTLSRVARRLEADPRVRVAVTEARRAFAEAYAACLDRIRGSMRR